MQSRAVSRFISAAAFVAGAMALGCGDPGTPRRTGIACAPFHGDVLDAPPGSNCDSAGDCQARICDPDYACEQFCSTHGGPAPCPDDAG